MSNWKCVKVIEELCVCACEWFRVVFLLCSAGIGLLPCLSAPHPPQFRPLSADWKGLLECDPAWFACVCFRKRGKTLRSMGAVMSVDVRRVRLLWLLWQWSVLSITLFYIDRKWHRKCTNDCQSNFDFIANIQYCFFTQFIPKAVSPPSAKVISCGS